MSKELEAVVRISGNLDANLRSAIDAAVKRLDQLDAAAKESGGAIGELADKIKDQSSELKAAQKQYASYVLAGEEGSDQARELADKIQELSSDLNRNKSSLEAAERAARDLADSFDDADDSSGNLDDNLDDVDDAARNSKEGFTVLKGAMANLVSAGFQKLIGAAKEAVSALLSLSDETQEFRMRLGSLESSYDTAGFSADVAASSFKSFYGILGDEDRTIETATNVSRMVKSQQELNDWVTITTGAFAAYNDALPVEGLAEAAGETAKTGQVTGVMADALNWSSKAAAMFSKYMSEDVTTAEDAFNVALSECSNEQERQALINETLLSLYGDTAQKYRELNGGLIANREATAKYLGVQASLGDTMEPLNTAWTEFKTTMLNAVAPALQTVAEKMQVVIQWTQEHPAVVQALVAALAVLAAGITAITIAVAIYTGVQMLANAALLPVIGIALAIVAAIAVVIGVVVALYTHWDTVKQKASEVWQAVQSAWDSIATAVTNAIQTVANAIRTGWSNLVGTVKGIWNNILNAIVGVWNSIKAKASAFVNGVKSAISSGWSSLTSILTAPFRALINFVGTVQSKISGLFGKITSIKDKISSIKLPTFASGGFTSGPSIAGEAGTEAVISFNKKYRAQNLAYWAKAGEMLGADDAFALTGETSGTYVDLGGVNFSPNIVVKGNAKKDDIIAAIRESYPEFMDMLDELISEREETVYA